MPNSPTLLGALTQFTSPPLVVKNSFLEYADVSPLAKHQRRNTCPEHEFSVQDCDSTPSSASWSGRPPSFADSDTSNTQQEEGSHHNQSEHQEAAMDSNSYEDMTPQARCRMSCTTEYLQEEFFASASKDLLAPEHPDQNATIHDKGFMAKTDPSHFPLHQAPLPPASKKQILGTEMFRFPSRPLLPPTVSTTCQMPSHFSASECLHAFPLPDYLPAMQNPYYNPLKQMPLPLNSHPPFSPSYASLTGASSRQGGFVYPVFDPWAIGSAAATYGYPHPEFARRFPPAEDYEAERVTPSSTLREDGSFKTRQSRRLRLWAHIYLHMQQPGFDLVPRLIGRGGCNMRRIAELTGAKLRIRGQGSGHLEIDGKNEAPVPLMVAVTSDLEDASGFRKAIEMTLIELKSVEGKYRVFCEKAGFQHEGPCFSMGVLQAAAAKALGEVLKSIPSTKGEHSAI